MKFKLLAVLAIAGICAGSLALADDAPSQDSQPAVGSVDNTQTGGTTDTTNGGATDNAGSSQDSMPPSSSDDNSTDTGTGDDDY